MNNGVNAYSFREIRRDGLRGYGDGGQFPWRGWGWGDLPPAGCGAGVARRRSRGPRGVMKGTRKNGGAVWRTLYVISHSHMESESGNPYATLRIRGKAYHPTWFCSDVHRIGRLGGKAAQGGCRKKGRGLL